MLSVTLLAYAMIVVFMVLVMSGRVSALIALILVPLAFGALAGFGGDLGKMSLDGIRTLAPTGVLLLFAILYFGVMIDAGLFDPVVRLVLRAVKGDPVRIVVGTALLADAGDAVEHQHRRQRKLCITHAEEFAAPAGQ